MWLAIIGITVLFIAAILVFTRNQPFPTQQVERTVRSPRQYSVYFKNSGFGPTNLRILINDSVVFRNDSQAMIIIESDFGSSGELIPGAGFTRQFPSEGIFKYHTQDNLRQNGTITVQP